MSLRMQLNAVQLPPLALPSPTPLLLSASLPVQSFWGGEAIECYTCSCHTVHISVAASCDFPVYGTACAGAGVMAASTGTTE